jgi:hypothetical protein
MMRIFCCMMIHLRWQINKGNTHIKFMASHKNGCIKRYEASNTGISIWQSPFSRKFNGLCLCEKTGLSITDW